MTTTPLKKQILSWICHVPLRGMACLGFILILIYYLWAIQPLSEDDWGNYALYFSDRWPHIPENGEALRVEISHRIFSTNPFSLFKPGSLLTDIFVVGLFWSAFAWESLLVRSALTLLLTLGFPYLAQIGGWNLASGDYGLAAVWMFICYLFSRRTDSLASSLVVRLYSLRDFFCHARIDFNQPHSTA